MDLVTRVSDWMRFWAPEVKRRIDRGEPGFAECRDAYEALRREPASLELAEACWSRMQECHRVLDQAPPGAYDYLAHVGTYIS